MRPRHYILDKNGNPRPSHAMEWGRWLDHHRMEIVLKRSHVGDVEVSTVFLGIDHNFDEVGPPILWETMVFGGEFDEDQARHTSKENALKGHERYVKLIKEKFEKENVRKKLKEMYQNE